MGFNCVRLTWTLFLIIDHWYHSQLDNRFNNLTSSNPSPESKPTIFQSSVFLSSKLISYDRFSNILDGNSFFGHKYFNPDLWIIGLTRMATLFNGATNVVSMNLRNESRGLKQNVNDWCKYTQKGAKAVRRQTRRTCHSSRINK
ncbi:hypothetical protein V6N11_047934 [Hibiscus sabdariffa]|uniref:Uncharacterized protein n=2 Tax=Hibiscus sabdariffa TaxID=183260 RepID=A0ABR2NX78_9ROSI